MKRKLPANTNDFPPFEDTTNVAVRVKFLGTRIKTKESRLLALVPPDSGIGKSVLEQGLRPAYVSIPLVKTGGPKVTAFKPLNAGSGAKKAAGAQLVRQDKSIVPALLYSSGDLVIEQSQKKSSVLVSDGIKMPAFSR